MWNDIAELRSLSTLVQWTSIALIFFGGFLQVGKYVVDRREKELSSIEQAAKENPIAQIIHTGSAAIELIEESNDPKNNHFMDSGAFAAFGENADSLMIMRSLDSFAAQTGNHEVVWRAVLSLDLADKSVGKAIRHLRDAEYIQMGFGPLKSGSKIKSGFLTITLNSAVRLQASIPKQEVINDSFFVRDMKPIADALQ
jgi:hypothetical protein